MITKVVLAAEGLAAEVAAEGPLVGVRPLVDQQIVGLGKLALAEAADELLSAALAQWFSQRQLSTINFR